MEPSTKTYKEIYEGAMFVTSPDYAEPYPDYNPTYYKGDIGYEIKHTHKLAQDKPTVTIIIPAEKLALKTPTAAAADFCLRRFAKYIDALNDELYNRSRPDSENGKYYLCRLGGEVLVRNTSYFAMCSQKDYTNGSGCRVYINGEAATPPILALCIRMQIQLPKGKLKKVMRMLCRDLPGAVDMFLSEFDENALNKAIALSQKQALIREYLRSGDYCAFIANGSILPRSKGTDLPMENAVPFTAPPDAEIEICGVKGMGIRRGVTVITGGGYSGKSTLLNAIAAGIYDHAEGDGRELCITDDSAATICAEDGRSVKSVNISPFIKWLPDGDTSSFSTDRASGSTSQGANIMEAVDAGAKLLLIDEDKSATNFMIRDSLMKELIEKEPITPFTDRVNELYSQKGVSTILVIGGSGEYLSVADKIYLMDEYRIHDVTEKAKAVSAAHDNAFSSPPPAHWEQRRTLYADGFTSFPTGSGSERLEVSDMGFIIIGDEQIDVRGLRDITTNRQLYALGYMLRYLETRNNSKAIDLRARIDELYRAIDDEGLDMVFSSYFTTTERFIDLPRKQELIAVINRMRKIKIL